MFLTAKKFYLSFLILLSPFVWGQELTILHTNDLHSHFEGPSWMSYRNGPKQVGHYARLATIIKEKRKTSTGPTFLFDAGDFYAGTVFSTIFAKDRKEIPEYLFFKKLNYDVVTLGNHEYDLGDQGVEDMTSLWGEGHPFLVNSHHQFSIEKLRSSVVLEKDGIKVAVLGALGIDALNVSRSRRKKHQFHGEKNNGKDRDMPGLIKALKREFSRVKNKAEFFVLVIHGGYEESKEIAEQIPELNLIVAGHTHTPFPKPYLVGNTVIAQAGCYGQYLGHLTFEKSDHAWHLKKEQKFLTKITANIEKDEEVSKFVEVHRQYLESIPKYQGLSEDVANLNLSLRRSDQNFLQGKIITEAILSELNKRSQEPLDAYFTSQSMIRQSLEFEESAELSLKRNDFIRMLGVGFDQNGIVGGDPVHFYLRGKDLSRMVKFMALYAHFYPIYTPAYPFKVDIQIRSYLPPFLGRYRIRLDGKPIEKKKLYHVATSEYVFQFLPLLESKTFGLVKLKPRDKNGKVLEKPYRYALKEWEYLIEGIKGKMIPTDFIQ